MKIYECKLDASHCIVRLKTSEGNIEIWGITDSILRCVYTREEKKDVASSLEISPIANCELNIEDTEKNYRISTQKVCVEVHKLDGRFTWKDRKTNEVILQEGGKELVSQPLMIYSTNGEKPDIRRVQTVDGERNFVENLTAIEDHMAYHAKLYFDWKPEEKIYGLGQGEEGIFNYRGNVQYLYQHNMRIPIPFFQSNKNYAILMDCGSIMTFQDDTRGSYVYMDCVEQLDYYFIAGKTADDRIHAFRQLTGKAVMLPKWAYGYVQSKERYKSQEEFIAVASEYRKREIGLDCLVQDWLTWEDGKWGNKKVDKTRFPNIGEMNEKLHEMNVHSMVSVWPNMNTGTDNYNEMEKANKLLYDYATYDAFDEEARELYWKQMDEELFSGGYDSWWCDSTEPFSGPDWNGAYLREPWERFQMVGNEHKKFLRADRANLYAVAHAKGIFENQRKNNMQKRVLNLTRSGYASSQKYGTVLWSGDTCATWDNFRKQITEGLNMCLSGIPYWTLDIGAFFTVNENWRHRGCGCNTDSTGKWFWRGDYETGGEDLGYRELYVRWFEYGAFLPMFRSHGTDTPREVWNFGQPGELFYDALVHMIEMRYQLIPYIYSLAGAVWKNDGTMMRSLLFDFPDDEKLLECSQEYMFGDSLLICPVTEPMYYERNSKELHKDKKWQCYLPQGTNWYDFYSKICYHGGQNICVDAPLGHIPVFVKSGAIIPMEHQLSYASEIVATPLEIHIFSGCDGEFILYEDEGDGYGYENGNYQQIRMTWKDAQKTLHIGMGMKEFPQGMKGRKCVAILGEQRKEFIYQGEELRIEM